MTHTTDLDAHCRRRACDCAHVTCHRGWIDTQGTTTPCQWCRPDLHRRWLSANQARHKGYPVESVHRILRGDR